METNESILPGLCCQGLRPCPHLASGAGATTQRLTRGPRRLFGVALPLSHTRDRKPLCGRVHTLVPVYLCRWVSSFTDLTPSPVHMATLGTALVANQAAGSWHNTTEDEETRGLRGPLLMLTTYWCQASGGGPRPSLGSWLYIGTEGQVPRAPG